MSEWKPIETAPKDGTKIDVCNRFGERTPDVIWRRGMWCTWGLGGFDRMAWCELTVPPTHWMPLPAPPVEAKTEVVG